MLVMPDWMVDVKLPSVLHSSLFVSPWAESIELEEFFMNTGKGEIYVFPCNFPYTPFDRRRSVGLCSLKGESNTSELLPQYFK